MTDIPIVITSAGMQPTPPATINAQIIAAATVISPGLTILPSSLIEDVSSTETAGVVEMNGALVEAVNSLTPYGTNNFLLNQLGQIYGVTLGLGSNTSVYVIFTGPPGFVIAVGFTVSDGTYQYVIQDGGIIGASATTDSATFTGSIAGTMLSVSGVTGTIVASGQQVTGANVEPGTIIISGSGSTWTVNISQTVASEAMTATPYGVTSQLYALATIAGSWSVSIDTVTSLATSVPTGINLSVTNPSTGIPGSGSETAADYRSRVLQAGLASAQGMPSLLRTFLSNVPGVQTRLISILQGPAGSGWEVICGGGDPYQIAYAIYIALGPGIAQLVGSTLQVTNVTNANPAIVTTDLNHGYTTGQSVTITGVLGTMGLVVNNVPSIISVINQTQFSIPINTTLAGSYVGGGVVSPDLRNITVSINDYPNTYSVTFVNPPQQNVTLNVIWNTIADNLVSNVAVSQLAGPALVSYINSIVAGQPINLFELQATFQLAVVSILPTALLTRMVFTVTINGVTTAPEAGTGIIPSDPESYFQTALTSISIAQG